MNFEKELETCLNLVLGVRDDILAIYNSNNFETEIKSDNSPVTKADKLVDKKLREGLSKAFPNYAFLTEESVDDFARLNNDYVFIIDPIDGTKDFIAKNGQFTVNLGLAYKHEPVLGIIMIPASGEIYYGVKGLGAFYLKNKDAEPIKINCNNKTSNLTALTSVFHYNDNEKALNEKHKDKITTVKRCGSSIKGCLIAKGEAEYHCRISDNTKEWDTCAMQAIVECAGGFILDYNGNPLKYNREDVYNRGGYIICNVKQNFLK